MRMTFRATLVLCCAALASAASAALPSAYQFVDLTPPGYTDGVARSGNASVQVGHGSTPTGFSHPFLWRGSADSVVDLHPGGIYRASSATGISGDTQVGYALVTDHVWDTHAVMWHGSAASMVDLNPAGTSRSALWDIAGNEQVGHIWPADVPYAAIWHGSASGVINVNPAWAYESLINATDGTSQVGNAYTIEVDGTHAHAVRWQGSAASAVNLTPAGMWGSIGQDVAGSQQVGIVFPLPDSADVSHAALWSGDANSLVDLNPTGFAYSEAEAMNSSIQVGWARAANSAASPHHAIAWAGSAGAFIDLQQFVPSGFWQSEAWGVGEDGTILGRITDVQGHEHMGMWIPVPEPTGAIVIVLAGCVTLATRRRG